MTQTLRAGFIGVGNMGGAMAARLCELGWTIGVRDIEPAREVECVRDGAEVHPTAAALAAAYPLVVVAVVDAAQCDDVLFGEAGLASAPAAAGPCVVLCPTLGPSSTESIAARLGEHGIGCIDAPMSGGPARARDGSMSLMVACTDALFSRHRALLEALSAKVFRVGERPGDGARTKLVNNLLAAINLAGAAEAIGLAERLGLDAAGTLAVIEQSSGQSWIGSDRMRRAIAGDWAPRAHTTLLLKDSRLALEMAAEAGFDAPLGSAAAARFRAACEAGFGDLDDASLLRLFRQSRSPSPARGRGSG